MCYFFSLFFFFNDTATTEIYTLSLHDALPICGSTSLAWENSEVSPVALLVAVAVKNCPTGTFWVGAKVKEALPDRKSTRLNSSHANISYAVFCLKKKKKQL